MRLLPMLIALPLLASCNVSAEKDKSSTVTVGDAVKVDTDGTTSTFAVAGDHGLKIDTDGFKAALDIPGMTLGGKDFDISGMKLYPGSEVHGMKVVARDKDGDKRGVVTISFTSPAAPEAVLTQAMTEAKAHDWTVTRAGNTLNGTKGDGDSMAYAVAASGKGSSGTIVLTDTK